MTNTADGLAPTFHRYLNEVLILESRSSNSGLQIPDRPTPLPAYDVQRALSNPSVLLEKGSQRVKQQMNDLLIFALWLRAVSAEHIPRDFASRAARFRFAVWSLPARIERSTANELYSDQVVWPAGQKPQSLSPARIRDEARAAQQEWKQYLDTWEDDPWLAARHAKADEQLEDDLRWLTTTWPRTRRRKEDHKPWPGPPKLLDLGWAADHRRVAVDTVERHWLARGSLLRATTALAPGNKWRWPALAAYPAAAAAVIGLLLCGHGDHARWGAVLLLGLGLVAAVSTPPWLSSVALLRVPAAAAVGLAILISLTSRWWTSSNGWSIGLGLLIAAVGYVALEARLHGTQRLRAVGRGLLVTIVGALHAAVLSIAVLGFVAPAVGERGECLDGWWRSDPWQPLPVRAEAPANAPPDADSCAKALRTYNGGAPAGVLLLMTGWSFAIGLAAQILWDDRPVTAPLGRLRRVRGGT